VIRRLLMLALLLLAGPALAENRAALAPGPHDAVVNQVRLWYQVAGRSSGEPVVFLHGGPGEGSQSFAALAGPALEPRLRMIYLDQRGSGRSERPWTNAYSTALLVEDLEQLRRLWNVPRLALIGHSFGTVVALEYAARYPDHVGHLVLAASAPDMPALLERQCDRLEATDPEAYRRAVAGREAGASARCNSFAAYEGEEQHRRIYRNMFPDPATEARVEAADHANGLRNTGELSGAIFSNGFLAYRFAHPERLTMPVLIIAGGADYQAVVEPQRALAARLPRGRIVEYPGAGHFMWAEQPERFARDVAAFLARP